MPSKVWKIWDFFKSLDSLKTESTFLVLFCKDPLILQMLRERLKEGKIFSLDFIGHDGSDLKLDWWEENFLTLSLFGNNDSYLIQNASKLDKKVVDVISNPSCIVDGRKVIMFFDQETEIYKALLKLDYVSNFVLEEAKHWEGKALLEFLADESGVLLSYDAREKILDSVNHTTFDFFNVLNSLKINYPQNKEISLQDLMSILAPNRFNVFELAELFTSRKFKFFYKRLLELNLTSKELEELSRYMLVHLSKLLDVSALEEKKYLSKYDKNLISHARLWDLEKITKASIYFKEIFLKARFDSTYLQHELKKMYLNL